MKAGHTGKENMKPSPELHEYASLAPEGENSKEETLVCLFSPYPVEWDGFVTVLAAVEENVSCSFQDLQDELGVSGTQSNILGCLPETPARTHV